MKSQRLHDEDVKKIQATFKRGCTPFSLKDSTSNMISSKEYKKTTSSLDISALNQVLSIENNVALVEPRVTMEHLVKETLKIGLIPPVVPEFKGITVGGAIMGASLESSSHLFGQFNDSCLEYEVLLGDGSIIIVNRESHSDLFYGLSSSYGTLGIILLAKIQLAPAHPWVHLHYHKFSNLHEMRSLLQKLCSQELPPDYIDGLIFSEKEGVIMSGYKIDQPKNKKTYLLSSWKPWFYVHAKEAKEEVIPLLDYLFRYDRGAFWMGSYLTHLKSLWQYVTKIKCSHSFTEKQKLPSPFLNRLLPLFFGKFLGSTSLYKALHKIPEEWFHTHFIVQDFYISLEKALPFIEKALHNTNISPLWICPIKSTKTPQIFAPHKQESPLLVDIGVYGAPFGKKNAQEHTKDLEALAQEIDARKMLYAATYYTEEIFWNIYDKKKYDILRERYHTNQRFLSIKTKISNLGGSHVE